MVLGLAFSQWGSFSDEMTSTEVSIYSVNESFNGHFFSLAGSNWSEIVNKWFQEVIQFNMLGHNLRPFERNVAERYDTCQNVATNLLQLCCDTSWDKLATFLLGGTGQVHCNSRHQLRQQLPQ